LTAGLPAKLSSTLQVSRRLSAIAGDENIYVNIVCGRNVLQ